MTRRVEDTLRDALLVALPAAFPDARFFYRNIIDQTVRDLHADRIYQLKSGTPGMADLFGYARASPWAIPFELELKAWDGRQSKEQKRWQTFVTMMKIPFLLLRQKKDETTAETVRRWISEIRTLLNSIRPASPPTSTTHSTPLSTDSPRDEPPNIPTSATPSG